MTPARRRFARGFRPAIETQNDYSQMWLIVLRSLFTRLLLSVLVTAFFAAAFAGSAGAVEIGSRCAAENGDMGVRGQVAEAVGGPTYTAPASGILTKWGTTLPAATTATVRLKIALPTATPNHWTVLRQSDPTTAVAGENAFTTRLPIAAGDRIAVYSPTYAGYCLSGATPAESSSRHKYGPDTPVGDIFTLNSATMGSRTALFAVIEPDTDADGYGDESQDLCPSRGDLQTACPTISLARTSLRARSRNLLFKVTANVAAPAKITVSARVPAYGGRRAKTIRLKTTTKNLRAGEPTSVKLTYPRSLLNARRALPSSATIRFKLKIAATGLVNTATKTVRAKLRGGR